MKLDFPQHVQFSTLLQIRITDINYGGHVGNDSILSLLHEARIRFLQSKGLSELDFGGKGLIMRDVVINFKNEIFYGDELIAEVSIANMSSAAFDVFYRLQSGSSEKIVVIAKTGMVCYDYSAKKVSSIPAICQQALSETN
jgi:acyl-CoA thioester hydrolase